MGTKTISIMDDVYRLLRARKKVNESFSEVIRKVLERKRDVMEFAGAWKNVTDDKIEEMKRNIKNLRKKSTKDLLELV